LEGKGLPCHWGTRSEKQFIRYWPGGGGTSTPERSTEGRKPIKGDGIYRGRLTQEEKDVWGLDPKPPEKTKRTSWGKTEFRMLEKMTKKGVDPERER